LVRLPNRVRDVLEKISRDLSAQETVSGVGLFGSWSRGDAVPSSDVDLLIVDKRDLNYEYVERIEFDGLLIDLNYIPKKWITGIVPPEIDQKLYEINILYDRDWSLTNTKEWMSKSFRRPERVDVRTETHLLESDMYLSRAASAYAREDFQSAIVFAGMGMESISKIPIEVNLLPISNSRFMEALQKSAEKVGMPEIFTNYLNTAQLSSIDQQNAEKKISLFRNISEDVASFMKDHPSELNSLHFRVKTRLQYYGKPAFLQGMIARCQAISNSGASIEAFHYVLRTLMEILENYAWLASAVERIRLDYTTLFRSLRNLKKSPTRIYTNAVEAFNLKNISREETERAIKSAKETNLNLRRQRKNLIGNFVKPTI